MMQKEYRQPRLPMHPAVFWSRMKLRWPFLVWIAAIVIVAYAFFNASRFGQMSGVVEVRRENISPLETSRIKEIRIDRGQRVEAGDTVAVLDTAQLDAELELERLQLERQFSQAVRQQESARQDLLIRQAESEAELAVLNEEVARLDDLLARRLVDSQVVSRLRARQEALRRAVELYPAAIAQAEAELASARSRLDQLARWLEGSAEAPESERIGFLRLRRDSFTLRAQRAGRVSEIFHEAGDVVPDGGVIATIIPDAPPRLIGFLPESNALKLKGGERAFAFRPRGRRDEIYSATVKHIGPEIMPLPGRVSTVPGQTVRGVRVVIELDEPAPFLPGETIAIRIGSMNDSIFLRPREASPPENRPEAAP